MWKRLITKFLRSDVKKRLNDTGGIFSFVCRFNSTGASTSTIYALSSGQGKCGVAVIRISGSRSLEALKKMTNLLNPSPRQVFLRKIYDPITRDIIDKGLCLWFPGPNSFTGEDSVEFQVHGGPAVIESLMSALSKLKFNPAEPGEFTKRAFYNGKLDLTEIEGLADLIHAETEQQRKQALLQAGGSLSNLYNSWKKELSTSLANIEAYIDFSEDDNIEQNVLENCNERIRSLVGEISKHLADGRRGEILRSGVRTVIIGQPNVGKSSLLNYLVRRNAAIVTPIAGTTRDIVELNTNISGYPVILADTAGLVTSTRDIVEEEGIKRARSYAVTADFIILMIDISNYLSSCKSFSDYVRYYIDSLDINDLIKDKQTNFIVVVNKIDLINEDYEKIINDLKNYEAVPISCDKEDGFSDLLNALTDKFKDICGNPSRENPTISQTRHRIHLINCVDYLNNYLEIINKYEYDMVIAAQQIRFAMRELGKITGHVSSEEILDIIFKNFCIGK
ncbi:tRNA modification GTPase GTPBP3, mitochondrial isoform X1 [Microplitis demolitor]|uniref:tRNA modification GTPase GTPBP3, mitochondrial isoform X1 n=1 Tax=Microplitis demolitor TaxID=69319 RepID=UPI0004CCD831|nr:tRNA modification GTPase GTPBP3, mitochondrial isoform X1 [Microplitis demolitor]